MHNTDLQPIIVGVAQQTWRQPDASRTPVDALAEVSALALKDTGTDLLDAIDAFATVRFIADTDPGMGALFPRNPGRQVAERLGITNARQYQGIIGGNTPQYLVNHFARSLSKGEHKAVVISGAELLASLFNALRSGEDVSAWAAAEPEPTTLGEERDGLNDLEKQHALYEPINTYPLLENALPGSAFKAQQQNIARLCSSMSQVAATNPYAWKPTALSPEEILSTDNGNRYIGYPYTKSMNPVLAVDMAASLVMTTVGMAKQLGIPESQWIYFRGGADVNDIWNVSERPVFNESPAIRLAWSELSKATGIDINSVSDFDLYSCFPVAVQAACKAIGLPLSDSRGVTVTGGLPYMGGPGNNYSLHAIAAMVAKLRSRGCGHGLVTANGLYLTKHSLGLYSTEPGPEGCKVLESPALQSTIDSQPKVVAANHAPGPAVIETFTVAFSSKGPKLGIIIARNRNGERIIAHAEADAGTLQKLVDEHPVGVEGVVTSEGGVNTFHFKKHSA